MAPMLARFANRFATAELTTIGDVTRAPERAGERSYLLSPCCSGISFCVTCEKVRVLAPDILIWVGMKKPNLGRDEERRGRELAASKEAEEEIVP